MKKRNLKNIFSAFAVVAVTAGIACAVPLAGCGKSFAPSDNGSTENGKLTVIDTAVGQTYSRASDRAPIWVGPDATSGDTTNCDGSFEKPYHINTILHNITAETISSTISSEMKSDAVIAVIIATICMLVYIWFRFKDIRFAASSVAALLHDVLVVLAFYAVAKVSVGSTFIACMLTIVGYSINATIVIFDRIRENLAAMQKKDVLEELVNRSISQTLSRSIFTSLTTFIMVAALYVLGVTSIKEFALPLMVGIVCGTYSSVCITGALWYVLRTKIQKAAK